MSLNNFFFFFWFTKRHAHFTLFTFTLLDEGTVGRKDSTRQILQPGTLLASAEAPKTHTHYLSLSFSRMQQRGAPLCSSSAFSSLVTGLRQGVTFLHQPPLPRPCLLVRLFSGDPEAKKTHSHSRGTTDTGTEGIAIRWSTSSSPATTAEDFLLVRTGDSVRGFVVVGLDIPEAPRSRSVHTHTLLLRYGERRENTEKKLLSTTNCTGKEFFLPKTRLKTELQKIYIFVLLAVPHTKAIYNLATAIRYYSPG